MAAIASHGSPPRHRIEHARRGLRADARQQLQHAEAGDAVARVLSQRRKASTSLTCAASRNFRPPNFTYGMLRRTSSSSSTRAVVRRAEQHRLLLQRNRRLASLQHLLDDIARLRRLRRRP